MIYISYFDETLVDGYLEKRFPGKSWNPFARINLTRRAHAALLLRELGSLQYRPLLLSHIDALMEGDAVASWSRWRIFEALIQRWLWREERKIVGLHRKPANR